MAITTLPMTIAAGSSISPPLQLPPNIGVVRLGAPDAWDAAPLTFVISSDGVAFLDLHHAAETPEGMWAPYPTGLLSVVPNNIVLLPPAAGFNVGWLQLRSGTRSRPINQTADRTFALVLA